MSLRASPPCLPLRGRCQRRVTPAADGKGSPWQSASTIPGSRGTDRHTSDVGHWFAMTKLCSVRSAPSPLRPVGAAISRPPTCALVRQAGCRGRQPLQCSRMFPLVSLPRQFAMAGLRPVPRSGTDSNPSPKATPSLFIIHSLHSLFLPRSLETPLAAAEEDAIIKDNSANCRAKRQETRRKP